MNFWVSGLALIERLKTSGLFKTWVLRGIEPQGWAKHVLIFYHQYERCYILLKANIKNAVIMYLWIQRKP